MIENHPKIKIYFILRPRIWNQENHQLIIFIKPCSIINYQHKNLIYARIRNLLRLLQKFYRMNGISIVIKNLKSARKYNKTRDFIISTDRDLIL
jgi:hypothetical protein